MFSLTGKPIQKIDRMANPSLTKLVIEAPFIVGTKHALHESRLSN
jgi:hypothetical protein